MKYVKVEWPEIQDYMDNPEYPEECYFDPEKKLLVYSRLVGNRKRIRG